MADLLAQHPPSYVDLAAYEVRRGLYDRQAGEPWGRYLLLARIPAGPGDECFVATPDSATGFMQPVFLRRFPRARLDDAWIAGFKRRALINHLGIEQVFELGRHEQHGFVVGQLVEGAGLDHFDAALRQRGERLPWRVALAILHDALERLAHLHEVGVVHDDVTPARLRLALAGGLYLCHGLPEATEPAWAHAVCELARPILRLAATEEERALLDELLRDDAGGGALAVASDALVLRHPELDPVLPALLLPALERAPLAAGRAMLAEDLPAHGFHRMWELVAEVFATPRPGRA